MSHYALLSSVAVATLTLFGTAAHGDQVINDDLIVTSSVCIGFDCVNGEVFDFDTLRLKENNTRIQFNDTSAGSFPTNNWQIRANSSSSGGGNFLGFVDQGASGTSESGTVVFSVAASAGANALVVNAGGNTGFGTASPVVKLHAVNGNTPTLRLEQNGTSGFAPQTWDLAGNEANFFLRDVTNGSRLVFRVLPNAPSNSLFVAANGSVGLGTAAPSQPLHVRRTDGTARVFVEEASAATANNRILLNLTNNGASQLALVNTNDGSDWRFQNFAGTFRATKAGTGVTEMELDASGNMTIAGEITTSGSCSVGCDRVFDADYVLPSIEEHSSLMWANGYLPNVGPTPEQGAVNMSDKMLRMLNELEQAHIYIDQLHRRVEQLEASGRL